MNIDDSIPEQDPAPAQPAADTDEPYACGAWLGGLATALGLGAIGDVLAIVLGAASHSLPAGLIIGLCPAAILILVSRRFSRPFAAGMITGACLVALVGGACGAMLGSFGRI